MKVGVNNKPNLQEVINDYKALSGKLSNYKIKEMKRILFYILFLLAYVPIQAQDGEEYRMELGAGIGMMGYLGDFNSSLTKNLQPMGTVLARYAFNPYMGLKFNISYGKIKGKSSDIKTYYPKICYNTLRV